MRNALLRDLYVDGVVSKDAIGPLDHLAPIFLSHVFTIRVDSRLEGTVLFGRSPPKLLRVVAEQPVPEEGIEI